MPDGYRVLENAVLRNLFGPTKDDKTGKWKRLHYKELDVSTPHKTLFG